MAGDNEKPARDSAGERIAAEMVKNLVIANENAAKTHELLEPVVESLDELNGYFECFNRTMGILSDMKRGSRAKRLSLDDFVTAWATAEEETFPDDDDDGDSDDDGDDPPVPEPEPVSTGDRRV